MKTLCKKAEKLSEKPEKYIVHVLSAEYICKKCGRVANTDEVLCKSVKINKLLEQKE